MRTLAIWEWCCFFFTAVVGTLTHFLYDWSGKNKWVGLFCPVNESIWEHLKMLFFPMLLFSIMEYGFVGAHSGFFIPCKALALLWGPLMITVLFYTYSGIMGANCLWADIATFFLGTGAAPLCFWNSAARWTPRAMPWRAAGLLAVGALAFCFIHFTHHPPRIALFCDPSNGRYGPR